MKRDHPQQLLLGFQLEDGATFENFQVAEPDSQLLQHLRERVLQSNEPVTVVWGRAGIGKTHLLQALCHELTGSGGAPIYLPLDQSDQLSPEMLDGLEELDLVCLDNVEAIAGQADWERALFNFYNRARETRVRVVLTADRPPGELPLGLPDLRSRLQAGVIYQLHELSDPEKSELLKRRARLLGFELPEPVIEYVLQRHDRQVGALVQLLEKLDEQSLLQKRKITVPLVRQVMDW